MRIVTAKNYEDMSRKAAGIIAAQVLLKPDSVLGLATGGTPLGAYRQLIELFNSGDIDFSGCTAVNLDEYVGLGPDDRQSYRYFMWNNLFRHININSENTYIPDGKNLDAESECSRYDGILERVGPVDMQLLGIGVNGHIAFNEPASHVNKTTNMVELSQDTIDSNKRFFDREEDVPRRAYSMGIKSILDAKRILLIANGENKADALYNSLCGQITPNVPASLLQLHNNLIVVADEAALSKMKL